MLSEYTSRFGSLSGQTERRSGWKKNEAVNQKASPIQRCDLPEATLQSTRSSARTRKFTKTTLQRSSEHHGKNAPEDPRANTPRGGLWRDPDAGTMLRRAPPPGGS